MWQFSSLKFFYLVLKCLFGVITNDLTGVIVIIRYYSYQLIFYRKLFILKSFEQDENENDYFCIFCSEKFISSPTEDWIIYIEAHMKIVPVMRIRRDMFVTFAKISRAFSVGRLFQVGRYYSINNSQLPQRYRG